MQLRGRAETSYGKDDVDRDAHDSSKVSRRFFTERKRVAVGVIVCCGVVPMVWLLVFMGGTFSGSERPQITPAREVELTRLTLETAAARLKAGLASITYDAVHTVTQVVQPQPWWFCTGKVHHDRLIREARAKVDAPPYDKLSDLGYYSKVAEQQLRHSVPELEAVPLSVERIERWRGPQGGTQGLIDLMEVTKAKQRVFTVAFSDDEATPLRSELANFPAQNDEIWFVLTVYNRAVALQRFLEQMKRFQQEGLEFRICIAGFEGSDGVGSLDEQIQRVQLQRDRVRLHEMPLPFRKTAGLQACLALLAPQDIAFITDVDIKFPPDILDRVRRYVVQGRSVFNPIVFYACPAGSAAGDCVEQGWADGGPGIIAGYAGDLLGVGGYDTETYGEYHGFEDMDLFFRVRSGRHLAVVRKREEGLWHLPHAAAPWRLEREKKYGKSWQEYWDVLSKKCSIALRPL